MRLKTISAHIERSVDRRGDYTSLSFEVALDNTLDRLDLETGEVARSPDSHIYSDLKDPNPAIFVSVFRASGGRAPIDEGIGLIGTVHYVKAWNGEDDFFPSRITFRLYLSDDDYKRLLDSASHGVMPTTFQLHHTDGIEERGPDGNDKRWDNKARPVLPIDGVSWNYEIAAPALPLPAVEPAPLAAPKKHEPNRGMWVIWIVMMALAVGIGWLFKK